MDRKHRSSILVIGIVCSLVFGLIVSEFSAAETTQTSLQLKAQRWEYCSISQINYFSGNEPAHFTESPYYRATIVYSSNPGTQVEMKIPFPNNPVLFLSAKLGLEEWEMVGQASLDLDPNRPNQLLFKRPVK